MLPYNLLLLPIIGGFYLITNLEYYKYLTQRLSPQAVVFNSVIAGTFLLLAAFITCSILTSAFPSQTNFIKQNLFPVFTGTGNAYFGTAICSFFLGIVVSLIGNLFINERKAVAKAIDKIGNGLEIMFKTSYDESEPLQITLKNNKVYIGYVELLHKPQHTEPNYVTIIPLMSGYRDGEKKEFHITTDYSKVYAHYIANGQIQSIGDLKVTLVIQVGEIISATLFSYDVFEKFSLSKTQQTPKRKRKTSQPAPVTTTQLVNN